MAHNRSTCAAPAGQRQQSAGQPGRRHSVQDHAEKRRTIVETGSRRTLHGPKGPGYPEHMRFRLTNLDGNVVWLRGSSLSFVLYLASWEQEQTEAGRAYQPAAPKRKPKPPVETTPVEAPAEAPPAETPVEAPQPQESSAPCTCWRGSPSIEPRNEPRMLRWFRRTYLSYNLQPLLLKRPRTEGGNWLGERRQA